VSSNNFYRIYLWAELTLLFVIVPVALSQKIPTGIKIAAVLLGVAYVVYVSNKVGLLKSRLFNAVFSARTIRSSLVRLLIVLLAATAYGYAVEPSLLFLFPLTKPLMWLGICLGYALFSAFPLEFIYRVFFYNRYRALFGTHFVFVLYNSLLFALAHLIFGNNLVLVIAFIGGLLFNYSYSKNQSYLLVSIEHSVYGCWLFTIGMTEMLAIPN
tara:strand:+ start:505 stop:1143 length:639 start_codon:yes stop_codon:yes gene_type:complete